MKTYSSTDVAKSVAEFYLGKDKIGCAGYDLRATSACIKRYKKEFDFLNFDHKGDVTNMDIFNTMNRYRTSLIRFYGTKFEDGKGEIDFKKGEEIFKEYRSLFEKNWSTGPYTVLLKPKKGFFADNSYGRYERLPESTKDK